MEVERRGFLRIEDKGKVETMKGAIEIGWKRAMAMKRRVHRKAGDFLFPERMVESKEDTSNTENLLLSEGSGNTRKMVQIKRELIVLFGGSQQIILPVHLSRPQSANRFEYRCTSQATRQHDELTADRGEDERVKWDAQWNR